MTLFDLFCNRSTLIRTATLLLLSGLCGQTSFADEVGATSEADKGFMLMGEEDEALPAHPSVVDGAGQARGLAEASTDLQKTLNDEGVHPAELRRKMPETNKSGIPLAAPKAAVDKAAYSYQRRAISRLKKLISKKQGGKREAALLARLGLFLQENADIVFRIAHSEAYFNKRKINLLPYNQIMTESVQVLSRIVEKYPDFADMPHVMAMRARAFSELNMKERAVVDYEFIVKNYPSFPQINSVYLALADYAGQANRWDQAIVHLRKVEKAKEDAVFYPYALYKSAWAYYHINKVDHSFRYVRRFLNYYNNFLATFEGNEQHRISNQTLRNDILTDSTSFYLRGRILGNAQYATDGAYSYFTRLAGNTKDTDETFGKMLVRYAELLRAEGLENDQVIWKDELIDKAPLRHESLEVLLITFDDQLKKYSYPKVLSSVKDLVRLYERSQDRYSFVADETFLLNTAQGIQGKISQYKGKGMMNPTVVLAQVYRGFLKIVKERDGRVYLAHYNLAEALTGLKRNAEAIEHYEWIVENRKDSRARMTEGGISVIDAALKALALRYSVLTEEKVVGRSIKPMPLGTEPDAAINSGLVTMAKWTNKIYRLPVNNEEQEKLNFYLYETNRALYADGYRQKAVERMVDFVEDHPSSQYSFSSANLVLDTYIAGKNWREAHDYANRFMKIQWSNRVFLKTFYTVAADAYYKMAEDEFNGEKYDQVVKKADHFLEKYGNSTRREEWLNLVSRSAMAVQDNNLANKYLGQIIEIGPKAAHYSDSLLLRANNYENRFGFSQAAEDYRKYLELFTGAAARAPKVDDVRKKILLLAWVSGNQKQFKRYVSDEKVCSAAIFNLCDQFSALSFLGIGENGKIANSKSISPAGVDKKPKDNQSLWALVALAGHGGLNLDTRLALMQTVTAGWSNLDPIVRFSLSPVMVDLIPDVFVESRLAVVNQAKVQADQASIKKRLKMIQKVEAAAVAVNTLPFANVRAQVLNEVAGLYFDLAGDIDTLPAPKGLSDVDIQTYRETMKQISNPFADQGKGLRRQAFSEASLSGVEDNLFQEIATEYFNENPKEASVLLPKNKFLAPTTMRLAVLRDWDEDGKWDQLDLKSSDLAILIKSGWTAAIQEKDWVKVGFYLEKGRESKAISNDVLSMMKAISFISIGARAEGLGILDVLRKSLEGARKHALTVYLLQYYVNTLAKGKVMKLFNEVEEDYREKALTEEQINLVGLWMGK